MISLVMLIECIDVESAQNMKRSFLKNTIGYDVTVLLENEKHYIVITLKGDLS